jgi:hypothetical protein
MTVEERAAEIRRRFDALQRLGGEGGAGRSRSSGATTSGRSPAANAHYARTGHYLCAPFCGKGADPIPGRSAAHKRSALQFAGNLDYQA